MNDTVAQQILRPAVMARLDEPLERYAYQFYVAPSTESLAALIKSLPADRRAMWTNKRHAAMT